MKVEWNIVMKEGGELSAVTNGMIPPMLRLCVDSLDYPLKASIELD